MDIPRFWARSTEKPLAPNGKFRIDVWGWSSKSDEEARLLAEERSRQLAARPKDESRELERYPYGVRPIREEVIEAVPGAGGANVAVVTRNRYGALILNTARAMFIDVDAPPPRSKGLLSFLRGGASRVEDETLVKLRESLRAQAPRTFRIYRTAAGYRVLAIDREHDPRADETQRLMTGVGADPRFVQLCRAQESFRARLTPKPWRCGCSAPASGYPREDNLANQQFSKWLARYEAACRGRATCRFLEQVGSSASIGAIRPIVAYHDARTQATEELPLA